MSGAAGAFLARAGWGDAARAALAGDASARRYERLTRPDGSTAVLMIAPPEDRAALEAFRVMAGWLIAQGLSAPRILAVAEAEGFALLEDFGDGLIARLAGRDPAREAALYAAAEEVLGRLIGAAPPPGLTDLTPARLAAMTDLAFDMLPPAAPERALRDPVQDALSTACAAILSGPRVVALRDFHAENLIWLPDRNGAAGIGLLDFQDAVTAPAGYDLVSLLDDARRDVPGELKALLIRRHGDRLGLGPEDMARRAALLSLQRNLRILGVFTRLARDLGKPGYLAHLPRVAGHVARAARHPGLEPLRAPVLAVAAAYAGVAA